MSLVSARGLRTLFVCALVLLLGALPAAAQKRRAVRSPGAAAPPPPPPVGQCHTFGLVRTGLVATYKTTVQGGPVDFIVTYLSDTPTETRTTQKVTTPQGSADVETRIEGEVVGPLRALKHIYTKTTAVVPVIGSLVTEVDIDFVPSLAAGPAQGWCVGATWEVPPTTETITARSIAGTQIMTVTTLAATGEVLAVGESITVPAGTFQTVKYRGALVSGNNVQPAVTWMSMEHNIVVRQDSLDANGAVTSVTELMALQ